MGGSYGADPPNKESASARHHPPGKAKWPGNASWQEGQWATAKETKASSRQRQTDATKTLAVYVEYKLQLMIQPLAY